MMSQDTWLLDEIEVEVTGFFSTHHYFETASGTWGEMTFPAFASHGLFKDDSGRELLMQKTHWLGTRHEFVDGEVVRGNADRKGLLNREMAVHFDGQEYLLQPVGVFDRGWYLVGPEGTVLLEVQPRGMLKQGAYVTIIGAVSADLVIFAYYLVHTRWQEDSAVAAAAS
jgi:hypothetical protein